MTSASSYSSEHLIDDPSELKFDSYWEKVEYNTELFKFNLWTEGLRQWVIILCTIGFTLLFVNSLRNLRRTSQRMDLDQIILIAEMVKVSIKYLSAFICERALNVCFAIC